MLRELRFDLTQFDSESANLHLAIGASEECDIARRDSTNPVAGSVGPAKHIDLEKTLRRFRGAGFDPLVIGTSSPAEVDTAFLRWAERRRLRSSRR